MIAYEIEAEFETESYWICSVVGCPATCFDADFAEQFGCARHGSTWLRIVRQFQNGHLVSEFKQEAA